MMKGTCLLDHHCSACQITCNIFLKISSSICGVFELDLFNGGGAGSCDDGIALWSIYEPIMLRTAMSMGRHIYLPSSGDSTMEKNPL